MKILLLFLTRIIGKIFQLIYPGYSTCGRCYRPWAIVETYSVEYEEYSGHFAICENCWNKTTIEEKIYYYTQIDWIKNNKEYKINIIKNILNECNIDPKTYFRNQKLNKILND